MSPTATMMVWIGAAGLVACGTIPAIPRGESAQAQRPELVAAGEQAVALAAEGDAVFWAGPDRADAARYRLRQRLGGEIFTLATREGAAAQIAADENAVYILERECAQCPGQPKQSLVRIDRANGATSILGEIDGSARGRVALDDEFVYVARWTHFADRVAGTFAGGAIVRFAKRDGGSVELDLEDGSAPSAIAAEGGDVFWVGRPVPSPLGIFNAAGSARVAGRSDGVSRLLYAAPRVLTWEVLRPSGPDLFARGPEGIFRIPRSGGSALTVASMDHSGGVLDLEVQGGHLYWNETSMHGAPGCLVRANRDGSGRICLDEGKASFGPLRAGEEAVTYLRDGDVWQVRG